LDFLTVILTHFAIPNRNFHDDADDENLWMSSTQFSQLLDKQEVFDNLGFTSSKAQKPPVSVIKAKKATKTTTTTNSSNNNNTFEMDLKNNKKLQKPAAEETIITSSYLDQEALIPFKKLKQVR
jgi:hypothetical protein